MRENSCENRKCRISESGGRKRAKNKEKNDDC